MPTLIELERENIELRERNIILDIENKQLKKRIVLLENSKGLASKNWLISLYKAWEDKSSVEKVDLEKLLQVLIVVGILLGSFLGISIGLTWQEKLLI